MHQGGEALGLKKKKKRSNENELKDDTSFSAENGTKGKY